MGDVVQRRRAAKRKKKGPHPSFPPPSSTYTRPSCQRSLAGRRAGPPLLLPSPRVPVGITACESDSARAYTRADQILAPWALVWPSKNYAILAGRAFAGATVTSESPGIGLYDEMGGTSISGASNTSYGRCWRWHRKVLAQLNIYSLRVGCGATTPRQPQEHGLRARAGGAQVSRRRNAQQARSMRSSHRSMTSGAPLAGSKSSVGTVICVLVMSAPHSRGRRRSEDTYWHSVHATVDNDRNPVDEFQQSILPRFGKEVYRNG